MCRALAALAQIERRWRLNYDAAMLARLRELIRLRRCAGSTEKCPAPLRPLQKRSEYANIPASAVTIAQLVRAPDCGSGG